MAIDGMTVIKFLIESALKSATDEGVRRKEARGMLTST
jgi:hypothetical protein